MIVAPSPGPAPRRRWPGILAVVIIVALVVLLLVGCAPQSEIRAGYPATVNHHSYAWHNCVKYVCDGTIYGLIVWSDPVDDGEATAYRHETTPETWRKMQIGDRVRWSNESRDAIVTDVRYEDWSGYYADGWHLWLNVTQCIENTCHTADVRVGADTYYGTADGSEIWFAGKKGERLGE